MNEDYHAFGVNVKDYRTYNDLARLVPGLETLTPEVVNFVYDNVQRDFWDEVDTRSQVAFGHGVASDGRSGGYCVPYREGEGYFDGGESWRVMVENTANHYLDSVLPNALKAEIECRREAQAEGDAEQIRLALIGADEFNAARTAIDRLVRTAVELSDHFGVDLNERLDFARQDFYDYDRSN